MAPRSGSGTPSAGRVGIQLAARYPELIDSLVLIAAAGLQRKRSLAQQARVTGKIYTFKTLKRLAPVIGMDVDKLRDSFGSADYRAAGEMRDILSTVVREDLSEIATGINCPTRLIYGERDTETPPEFGERLSGLIPHAELSILGGQDHYSLLAEGRHQVAKRIRDFLLANQKNVLARSPGHGGIAVGYCVRGVCILLLSPHATLPAYFPAGRV